MALSKKDYVAIAAAIRMQVDAINRWEMDTVEDRTHYRLVNSTLKLVAYDTATYFNTTNPRFNRDKFMDACGFIDLTNN